MNLKNAASAGTSVLQKLRHDIVAHIEPVISQYKAVITLAFNFVVDV